MSVKLHPFLIFRYNITDFWRQHNSYSPFRERISAYLSQDKHVFYRSWYLLNKRLYAWCHLHLDYRKKHHAIVGIVHHNNMAAVIKTNSSTASLCEYHSVISQVTCRYAFHFLGVNGDISCDAQKGFSCSRRRARELCFCLYLSMEPKFWFGSLFSIRTTLKNVWT